MDQFEFESVFEKISGEYYNLTAAEKKVADFVQSHQGRTQHLSISQLAEESQVAEATVSRFCRRLGYKGYNAFRLAVANTTAGRLQPMNPLSGEVLDDDSFTDVCSKIFSANTSAMAQTMNLARQEDYSAAADILEKAEKVLCMGQGGSMILAEEAAHLFSTIFGNYYAVAGAHTQMMYAVNASEKDALIFFSYSGATKDMMDTLSEAKKSGAKVILITHFPNSPGAALADVVLLCGADESPLQLGSVGARIAQLYLLDLLFSEVCRRKINEARERRTRLAQAMENKYL